MKRRQTRNEVDATTREGRSTSSKITNQVPENEGVSNTMARYSASILACHRHYEKNPPQAQDSSTNAKLHGEKKNKKKHKETSGKNTVVSNSQPPVKVEITHDEASGSGISHDAQFSDKDHISIRLNTNESENRAVSKAANNNNNSNANTRDDAETTKDSMIGGKTEEEDNERLKEYPNDTYSFIMAFENTRCFILGLAIFLIQVVLSLLLLLGKVITMIGSNDIMDGTHKFLPGDVELIVKVTQIFSIISYVIIGSSTIDDIVQAIVLFQNNRYFALASFCRFLQGCITFTVTLLLVYCSTSVESVILNFVAVSFISDIDDNAFLRAKEGYFGTEVQHGVRNIANKSLPEEIVKKRGGNYYQKNVAIFALFLLFLIPGICVSILQSDGYYVTERLRVEFNDEKLIPKKYNACYYTKSGKKNDDRIQYHHFDESNDARFGYCKTEQRWILLNKENYTAACQAITQTENNGTLVAYSSRTTSFDIESTFGDTWFSSGGTPLLNIQFLEKDYWTDGECKQTLGNGICDADLNKKEYAFDNGDCCGATCEGGSCGLGSLDIAFNRLLDPSGDGFPSCKNTDMVPITIRIEKVTTFPNSVDYDESASPLLSVTCNSILYLMVPIDAYMDKKNETIYLPDGADCIFNIRNSTYDPYGLPTVYRFHEVAYEIYDGEEEDDDFLKIAYGNSNHVGKVLFQIIPKCFKNNIFKGELVKDFPKESMYNSSTSIKKALDWLLEDRYMRSPNEGYDCSEFMVERFILKVIEINHGIYGKNWTQSGISQCEWDIVECNGGYIANMEFQEDDITGELPPLLGKFTNLIKLSFSKNKLTGNIPSELGQLTALTRLLLRNNMLEGSIPLELGQLTALEILYLDDNNLKGSIPLELGQLTALKYLRLSDNKLEGSVPSELGRLTALTYLYLNNNTLEGSIPSQVCELSAAQLYGCNNFTGKCL